MKTNIKTGMKLNESQYVDTCNCYRRAHKETMQQAECIDQAHQVFHLIYYALSINTINATRDNRIAMITQQTGI